MATVDLDVVEAGVRGEPRGLAICLDYHFNLDFGHLVGGLASCRAVRSEAPQRRTMQIGV